MHELRGFASQNLAAALNEAYAVSRATKCRQFLFSLSLNPPPLENVPTATFEEAIDKIKARLGLAGQPRAVVFHEKEGRRHCHAVWSRIDPDQMKAVPLPYTKRKLQEVARELYLEHGWTMPRGLAVSKESDPRNFTLSEWQQARRTGQDPRAVKAAFQDAWAISDSRAAFVHALGKRGYTIARGDRHGFVAVDCRGEVYAIAKWAGVSTKQVRARLDDQQTLPSVAEAKEQIARDMLGLMAKLNAALDTQRQERETRLQLQKQEMTARQRAERKSLNDLQEQRRKKETAERQSRFRRGVMGLWDRLTGQHSRIRAHNEREACECGVRDRAEKERLIFGHLDQRRNLKAARTEAHQEYVQQEQELRQDIKTYEGMLSEQRKQRLEEFEKERSSQPRSPRPAFNRSRLLDR